MVFFDREIRLFLWCSGRCVFFIFFFVKVVFTVVILYVFYCCILSRLWGGRVENMFLVYRLLDYIDLNMDIMGSLSIVRDFMI